MSYKHYPNNHVVRDFEKLIAMSEQEVQQLSDTWDEVAQHNENLRKKNFAERERAVEEAALYLEKMGVTVRKSNGYLAWFKNNVQDGINSQYPVLSPRTPAAPFGKYPINVKGVTFEFHNKNYSIVGLRAQILSQYNAQKEQQIREQELFTVSLEYATSHKLNLETVSAEGIIHVANEHAKAQILNELIEDDDSEVYFDECSECENNVYYPGCHRCPCGNRRVHLYITGDLMSGFEPVAEAY